MAVKMSDRILPLKRTVFALALFFCTATAFAVTPAEFYVDLLQKGITEYNSAEYDKAADLLRVAAFGLLDVTDRYQTAQIYRAIAADKLNDVATTRDAARRLLAAERVQRTYASLTLPASVRTNFESVAKKVLAPSEMAMLTSGAPSPQVQKQQPQVTTRTTTTTPAETKPEPQQNKPAPAQTTQSQPQQQTTPPRTKTTQPQTATPPPQQQQQAAKPQAPPPAKPEPKPEPKQETKVAETKPPPAQSRPAPAPTQAARNEPPRTETPAQVKPTPAQTAPATTTTPTPAQARELAQTLATADRALAAGNLAEARRLYRQLLDGPLTHEQAVQIAEGLYRSRDFASVLRAFDRIGTLRPGEEPYRFYLAVALYESGRYAAAKKELSTALNFIEITPDVARYRDKITSANE
jgi:tetratricopeptide (TPR) repeat protein